MLTSETLEDAYMIILLVLALENLASLPTILSATNVNARDRDPDPEIVIPQGQGSVATPTIVAERVTRSAAEALPLIASTAAAVDMVGAATTAAAAVAMAVAAVVVATIAGATIAVAAARRR